MITGRSKFLWPAQMTSEAGHSAKYENLKQSTIVLTDLKKTDCFVKESLVLNATGNVPAENIKVPNSKALSATGAA